MGHMGPMRLMGLIGRMGPIGPIPGPPTSAFLQHVEDREQKHPDDIDEMPIETGAFEESMFRRRYVSL